VENYLKLVRRERATAKLIGKEPAETIH